MTLDLLNAFTVTVALQSVLWKYSHHTIFAPVQKVKTTLAKFKFYKKAQVFVETLQIVSFQNEL